MGVHRTIAANDARGLENRDLIRAHSTLDEPRDRGEPIADPLASPEIGVGGMDIREETTVSGIGAEFVVVGDLLPDGEADQVPIYRDRCEIGWIRYPTIKGEDFGLAKTLSRVGPVEDREGLHVVHVRGVDG